MTKEEKYIAFLEEKVKSATSIRSNSAYTIALNVFKQMYGIPEIPPLPSMETKQKDPSENY